MMSVSIRSPTITVVSECASSRLSAERIINGFGLPMKYGDRPVAVLVSAATEPGAGGGPGGAGPGAWGLGAMNRAPRLDQPDRAGDRLERVGPRLAQHDVVGAAV